MSEGQGPIAIFDSGVGGLTVAAAIARVLPHESFVYLGDTARLPYGTKSPETITKYAVQATRALGGVLEHEAGGQFAAPESNSR
jgi:glutamate racemase